MLPILDPATALYRCTYLYITTRNTTSVYTMNINDTVERVTDGADLTVDEAREAARLVFEEATEAQIGALLATLRAKGRPRRRSRGSHRGCATPPGRSSPTGSRSSTLAGPAATTTTQSTSRRPPRSSRRARASRSPSTATTRCPPRREAPTCWRSRAPTWRPSRRRSRKRSRPTGSGSCSRPSSTRR